MPVLRWDPTTRNLETAETIGQGDPRSVGKWRGDENPAYGFHHLPMRARRVSCSAAVAE